jgi:hypothetical protein
MDSYGGFPTQYATGKLLIRLSESFAGRLCFAFAVGAVTGFVSYGLHALGMQHAYGRGGIIVSVGVAAFIAIVSYVEMDAVRVRRERVIQQVRSVAELNHHVRNALQVIHYAVHLGPSRTNLGIIEENIQKIDEALRDIYPAVGDPRASNRPSTPAGSKAP